MGFLGVAHKYGSGVRGVQDVVRPWSRHICTRCMVMRSSTNCMIDGVQVTGTEEGQCDTDKPKVLA